MLSNLLESTLEEGRVETKRQDINEFLETQFGDVPKGIKKVIVNITDLKKFPILVSKSAVVQNIDEFMFFKTLTILKEVKEGAYVWSYKHRFW